MENELQNLIRDRGFQKYHDETLALTRFNVFDVLEYANFEIRHSNVLAWLLRPSDSHGIGPRFLNAFLKLVNEDEISDQDVVEIKREHYNVDITVILKSRQRLLAIENKVGMASSDAFKQVRGYEESLRAEYTEYSIRSVLLTMSRDQDISESDFIHVSWSTIHKTIKSLYDRGAFGSAEVQAFIHQYLDTVRRHLVRDEPAADYFRKLLDDHDSALTRLRDVLVDEGETRVHAIGEKHGKGYGPTFVRLVKDFRQDPARLQKRAKEYLKQRQFATDARSNPAKTEFWLYWRMDKTAVPRGVSGWCIKWGMTFAYRKVTVSLYFHQQPRAKQPVLEQVKRFMRDTPVDRRGRDKYPLEEGAYFVVYKRGLLDDDTLSCTPASEVEKLMLDKLKEFLDSEESDYKRIEDYFRCLAFRPDLPNAT